MGHPFRSNYFIQLRHKNLRSKNNRKQYRFKSKTDNGLGHPNAIHNGKNLDNDPDQNK